VIGCNFFTLTLAFKANFTAIDGDDENDDGGSCDQRKE
jgi:hypothetical protein